MELVAREDEEAFEARACVGAFTGHNPKIWIRKAEWEVFLGALEQLQKRARGEARVAAMSPQEFELHLRLLDAAETLMVEGLVGRLWYGNRRPHRVVLSFAFALSREALPGLVRAAAQLKLQAAARR